MHLQIETSGTEPTETLRARISRRADLAFSGFGGLIQRIQVRLMVENGPKGEGDKVCAVRIGSARYPEVLVQDAETNLDLAINRAFARASRSYVRKLSYARHSSQLPVPTGSSTLYAVQTGPVWCAAGDGGWTAHSSRHPAASKPGILTAPLCVGTAGDLWHYLLGARAHPQGAEP